MDMEPMNYEEVLSVYGYGKRKGFQAGVIFSGLALLAYKYLTEERNTQGAPDQLKMTDPQL